MRYNYRIRKENREKQYMTEVQMNNELKYEVRSQAEIDRLARMGYVLKQISEDESE